MEAGFLRNTRSAMKKEEERREENSWGSCINGKETQKPGRSNVYGTEHRLPQEESNRSPKGDTGANPSAAIYSHLRGWTFGLERGGHLSSSGTNEQSRWGGGLREKGGDWGGKQPVE